MVWKWFRGSALLVAFAHVALVLAHAQKEGPSEYEVKSAFLYNFAKFVTWPTNTFKDTTAPLVIGVLGENPFGKQLETTVQGRIIEGRSIDIRYFDTLRRYDGSAHILFLAGPERRDAAEMIRQLRGRPVLTVGESEGFLEAGGAVNFHLERNRVRFDVNTQATDAAGLKLSSKLLSVAARVIGPKP
ncbi:MAG TPA: YfiR family protein [Methylomirabilota bacterium]|nr:YfiR family protein [Methylomirabilota bacterium]